jgi:hypothetical protein
MNQRGIDLFAQHALSLGIELIYQNNQQCIQIIKSPDMSGLLLQVLAERGGFEPPIPCGTPDFESGTFNLSATSPQHF